MAPEFWSRSPDAPGLSARLLWPVSLFYSLGGRLKRAFAKPYRAGVPVICVGNLVAGGAGKTPTVQAICDRLALRGVTPHVLSRGYGGSVKGPHRVDPERDTAAEVGDEPLLLAQHNTVWVGADRAAAARSAVAAGAQALVMDDGFQNPSLHKDLSFIVIDAGAGHGNGRVIPAGPLREPLRSGFARADCAILIGAPAPDRPAPWLPRDFACVPARLAPTSETHGLAGRRVVAFAGIGRPRKFFDTLREVGAELADAISFPDHHPYSNPMLMRLERTANTHDALLVTTEKDAMRLPAWFQKRVEVATVHLGFSDPALIDDLLAQAMAAGETASAFSALDDEPFYVPEHEDEEPLYRDKDHDGRRWRARGRR